MNIGLVIVAYNSGPDLTRLLESAWAGARDDLRVELFLHSAHGATVAACENAVEQYRGHCTLHDLRCNAGVARAWNNGILACYDAGADAVIVANDDILFGEGDLGRIAAHAVDHPEAFLVVCGGYHQRHEARVPSHGFSCYALQPRALEAVGCFDENLFPAYFEDCDYWRRATLLGLGQTVCPGTSVTHIGSGAIFRDPDLNRQNGTTFAANSVYYQRKWGGPNDRERFEVPFDDARFTLRIAPEDRHHPYGALYDRLNPEALHLDREPVEVAI